MGGVLLVQGLEDADRLQQRGHALVVEDLVQRQRVEDLRLDVVRVLLGQRLHRVRVVRGARVLIHLVEVLVELLDRQEPVALALGFGTHRQPLVYRVEPAFESRSVPRADERVRPDADRKAPVSDGASRVGLRDRAKHLDRLGEPERVQHPERALELLLRLGRARGLEQHLPELFLLLLGVVMAERGSGRECEQRCDNRRNEFRFHGRPSSGR